jgi:hypothetical protein
LWWNSSRCDESRRAERRERITPTLSKSVPPALRGRNGRSATIPTIREK